MNEPITRDDLLDWGIRLTESMMTSDELAEQGDRQNDELFTKPAMEITLSAPEPQGVELSTEVQDQISEFIAEATGLKAVVRFEAAEGDWEEDGSIKRGEPV